MSVTTMETTFEKGSLVSTLMAMQKSYGTMIIAITDDQPIKVGDVVVVNTKDPLSKTLLGGESQLRLFVVRKATSGEFMLAHSKVPESTLQQSPSDILKFPGATFWEVTTD